jgi:hypothetical protein
VERAGSPVQFVSVPLVGVPRIGVVSVVVPLAVRVPVTDTPAEVTATIVVVPESSDRLPLLSPVDTMPPDPVVMAAIELAMDAS